MDEKTFQNMRFTYVLIKSAFSYVENHDWGQVDKPKARHTDLEQASQVVAMDLKVVSEDHKLLGDTLEDLIDLASHLSAYANIPEDDWQLLTCQIKRAVLAYHTAVQIERKGK